MSKTFFKNIGKVCFIIFVAILISCSNFTVPKKITIQADPEIHASFGKVEASLTDYFSVEKIQELVGEEENFKVYEYRHDDNDDSLRFLAKLDYSMEIDGLDVEGSLQELENKDPIIFGYEEDNVTPSVLFSVPEIDKTINVDPISLELTDEITSSLKDLSSIQFEGVQPGLINDLENQNLPFLLELCDDEFDTVTFGEGTFLDIGFNQIPSGTVTTARINGIAIFDAAKFTGGTAIKDFTGNVDYTNLTSISMNDAIVYKEGNSDLVNGTNLTTSLDLSNKTLPKDICLVLNVSFEGGDVNSSVTITTQNSKFSDITLKKVTGFNTTAPVEVDFPAIEPIELADGLEDLKGAVIGSGESDGQISFSIDNLPGGVTTTTIISLNQADSEYNSITYYGLNITDKTVTDNVISLAGQKLNTNNINLTGSIKIEAIDATIDFTQELNVSAGVKIKKFDSVSLSDSVIPQDILTQEFSYSLADIAEYVNQIKFNKIGLALKLCNGLPLDATMKINSTFLEITNKEEDFPGNQTDLPPEARDIGASDITKNISDTTEFDLAISIEMPSSNGVITLNDITTGTDYKFYGQADLIIDWESVNFKIPDDYSGFAGSFPEEGSDPFDLSALTNILGDDITLSGIKPKLYISSDLLSNEGPLAGAEIQAVMIASYTKDEVPITKYLVGSADNSTKVEIVDNPELNVMENSLVKGTLPKASLELTGLEDVLTSGATDIKLEYDFKLGGTTEEGNLSDGITIKKESLDGLSQTSEINISLLIDLPIIFAVKPNEAGYAAFDIISLMNETSESEEESNENSEENENTDDSESTKETDLFNRAEGEDIEGIDTVLEFIEKVSIDLQYQNNTGMALTLVIQDSNARGEKLKKEVQLGKNSGTMNLTFDYEDAQYIKNTNPFYPDVLELRLPGDKTKKTEYKIRRDANISVILQGSVKTDIDYSIELPTGTENSENAEGEN